MEWKKFKKLSISEKFYNVEQLADLSLYRDFKERNAIINLIVNAKDEVDYKIAVAMLIDKIIKEYIKKYIKI